MRSHRTRASAQQSVLRMDILLIQKQFFKNAVQEVQLVPGTEPYPAPLRDANSSEIQLKNKVSCFYCAGAVLSCWEKGGQQPWQITNSRSGGRTRTGGHY